MDIKLPHLDYAALLPMLILFGAACVGVLIEAFVPRSVRNIFQLVLSLAAVAVALFYVVKRTNTVTAANAVTAGGAITVDRAGLFLQGALLVLAFVALL